MHETFHLFVLILHKCIALSYHICIVYIYIESNLVLLIHFFIIKITSDSNKFYFHKTIIIHFNLSRISVKGYLFL